MLSGKKRMEIMANQFEYCLWCKAPTGRAGKYEDSLYFGNIGPFCESCWNEIEEAAHAEA